MPGSRGSSPGRPRSRSSDGGSRSTLSIGSRMSEGSAGGLALLNACYFGNCPQARALIAEGCDLHYSDPRDGWMAIHYAARWGMIRTLNNMIEGGLPINIRTTGKETALHKAVRSNHRATCIWLMKHGADPNCCNGDGLRPSALTIEEDIIQICDNFEQFCKEQEDKKYGAAKNKIDWSSVSLSASAGNCVLSFMEPRRSRTPPRSRHRRSDRRSRSPGGRAPTTPVSAKDMF